jgi:hypothetical protein
MVRNKNIGRNSAIIFTCISLFFTVMVFSTAINPFIRMKKKGVEVNTRVVEIIYDRNASPPMQTFKMEFVGRDGKKRTKEYTNAPSQSYKFDVGNSVPMLINEDEYDDFWYYPDLKTRFWLSAILLSACYLITCICWLNRKGLQKRFEDGTIGLE